ncbi:MAG: PAS domain-containing sensor histidine kinase [Rhodospirillaceae bacterium]
MSDFVPAQDISTDQHDVREFFTEPGQLASLEQREQRYALAMLGGNDGLWDWDIDRDRVYISPRAEEILHIEADDISGSSWSLLQFIHPDDLAQFRTGLVDHIKGVTKHFESEYRVQDRKGRTHWVLHKGLALRDEKGWAHRMAGSLSDITRRKSTELSLIEAKKAAEEAAKAKSDFLAHMSHELRTPLNAIIGFADMMEREIMGPLKTPAYREYVEHISRSGRHLLSLINDVLDTAKVDAGVLSLNEEDVDLVAVVRDTIDLIRPRADREGVRLTLRIRQPLPRVLADPVRLRQIMLNILSNAVKFTPRDGRVDVLLRLSPRRGLVIIVADTGQGMAPEDLPVVMEIFGQVNSFTTKHLEGTGLGLPLSRKLIELHGGELLIESALGKGTQVTILMPLDRVIIA